MIVLGIDPGKRKIGYGAIQMRRNTITLKGYGVIETNPGRGSEENLVELEQKLEEVLNRYSPKVVGVEKLFFAKNLKTAIGVSEARGVIILTIKKWGAQITEFTPREVKRAVTGDGAADKKQVAKMITLLLELSKTPQPHDTAD